MKPSKFEIVLLWIGGLCSIGFLADYSPYHMYKSIFADVIRPISIVWTSLLLIWLTYRFWPRSPKNKPLVCLRLNQALRLTLLLGKQHSFDRIEQLHCGQFIVRYF